MAYKLLEQVVRFSLLVCVCVFISLAGWFNICVIVMFSTDLKYGAEIYVPPASRKYLFMVIKVDLSLLSSRPHITHPPKTVS